MGKTQALLSSSLMAGPGESGPALWCCTRGGFDPKDAERREGAPRWWGGARLSSQVVSGPEVSGHLTLGSLGGGTSAGTCGVAGQAAGTGERDSD